MSRTYRKCSITEEQTLVKFINVHMMWTKNRGYHYEYYLTDHGKKLYDKAMEEWDIEYYRWFHHEKYTHYVINFLNKRCLSWRNPPKQPTIWEFKKARVVFREIDYEKEVEEATKDYKKYKRDGRFYDGDVARSFKKNCAKELRLHNRRLSRQIIKNDDSWEGKPYPDTYLGKQHIWDYW